MKPRTERLLSGWLRGGPSTNIIVGIYAHIWNLAYRPEFKYPVRIECLRAVPENRNQCTYFEGGTITPPILPQAPKVKA